MAHVARLESYSGSQPKYHTLQTKTSSSSHRLQSAVHEIYSAAVIYFYIY